MKNFKKLMALVIAGAMVLGTMSFAGAAGETTGALSVNGDLKVEGLDPGDVVTYYQVIKWNTVTNADGSTTQEWAWGDDVTGLTPADLAAVVGDGKDGTGKITAEMAGKIAGAASGGTSTPAISGNTWTATVEDPGLYMVIVTPAKAGTLYNPIFVAANWVGDGEEPDSSNEIGIEANVLTYSDTAMAKKTTLDVKKEAKGSDAPNGTVVEGDPTNNTLADGAYTTDVDEPITFTIKTHVPKFAENFTGPVFKLTDKLNGLELTGANVKVYKAIGETKGDELNSSYYDITGNAEKSEEFVITFEHDYLWGKLTEGEGATATKAIPDAGQDIIVEYTAKVNDKATKVVNQEDNTVTLNFSTEPDDEDGHGIMRDKTNHFTFSIDANLLGHNEVSGSSTEAIKVGVDAEGNYIVKTSTYQWSNETHGPLEGAEFKLYKDAACTKLYSNPEFNGTVNSDATGRITIKGLDAGTYYLKETKAPTGYIKMTDVVTVVITADITEEVAVKDEETVEGEKVAVTYKTNILNGYTVTFTDSKKTATTTYTINTPASTSVAISANRAESSDDFELPNTKGVELPSTGGMGTTLFYIVGAILVLGAGILLVSKRRMAAN